MNSRNRWWIVIGASAEEHENRTAKDASENAAHYKVGHKRGERNLPHSIADSRQRLTILLFAQSVNGPAGWKQPHSTRTAPLVAPLPRLLALALLR